MIISLTGPSGIGKGYMRERIKKEWPVIKELTWITTRLLRPEELNENSNRRSISTEEFDALQNSNQLVLSQQLYGHRYGLNKSDLLQQKGIFYLTEFHIANLLKVNEWGFDIFSIALVPSSISFLQERLEKYRATETPKEIARRLKSAQEELEHIRACLSVFSLLVQISKDNENSIASVVIEALNPIVNSGEKQ